MVMRDLLIAHHPPSRGYGRGSSTNIPAQRRSAASKRSLTMPIRRLILLIIVAAAVPAAYDALVAPPRAACNGCFRFGSSIHAFGVLKSAR